MTPVTPVPLLGVCYQLPTDQHRLLGPLPSRFSNGRRASNLLTNLRSAWGALLPLTATCQFSLQLLFELTNGATWMTPRAYFVVATRPPLPAAPRAPLILLYPQRPRETKALCMKTRVRMPVLLLQCCRFPFHSSASLHRPRCGPVKCSELNTNQPLNLELLDELTPSMLRSLRGRRKKTTL